MEVETILIGIIVLIILYFVSGVLIKLLWGWLPLISAIIISIFQGMNENWTGIIVALFVGLVITKLWQDSVFYMEVEELIDKLFYLKD